MSAGDEGAVKEQGEEEEKERTVVVIQKCAIFFYNPSGFRSHQMSYSVELGATVLAPELFCGLLGCWLASMRHITIMKMTGFSRK